MKPEFNKKMKNKIISITGIITILLMTIGISFAYFSANLTGGEDSTNNNCNWRNNEHCL